MRYFGKRVEDLVVAAGTALFNNNLIAYEETIVDLEIELQAIENEIIRARDQMRLPPSSNEFRRLVIARNFLELFIVLFNIYWLFLKDGAPDYSQWANKYNKYYNRRPVDVFNSAKIQDAVDVSSFEYRAYIQLRTRLNPLQSGQPDIPVATTTILYYILPEGSDKQRISLTRRLPQPIFNTSVYNIWTKIWYLMSYGLIDSDFPMDKFVFFDNFESLQLFYTYIFPTETDNSVSPPITKLTTKFDVVEVEIPLRIIQSGTTSIIKNKNTFLGSNPNQSVKETINIYSVDPIYIDWITVKKTFEYKITRPLIFNRMVGRARIGTGRMKT